LTAAVKAIGRHRCSDRVGLHPEDSGPLVELGADLSSNRKVSRAGVAATG
jgi:hypothetical protein